MSMSDHRNRFAVDRILKFGGSSIETPERIKSVIQIITKAYIHSPHIAIVVSAFGGVTNHLIGLGKIAAHGKDDYQNVLTEVIDRHKISADTFIPQQKLSEVLEPVQNLLYRQSLEICFAQKNFNVDTLLYLKLPQSPQRTQRGVL